MSIKLVDKFYHPYSFSTNFGYSGKQEVKLVRGLLNEYKFSTKDSNVQNGLDFIQELAPNVRRINKKEVKSIKEIVRRETITGGFIPPDIQICHETLKLILLAINASCTILALSNKLSGDRISKFVDQAITKLVKRRKTKSLISSFRSRMKKSKTRKPKGRRKTSKKVRKKR